MPIGMSELLKLELYSCHKWHDKIDLFISMERLQTQFGLRARGIMLKNDGSTETIIIRPEDFIGYCQQKYWKVPERLDRDFFGYTLENILELEFFLPFLDDQNILMRVECNDCGDKFNDVIFRLPFHSYIRDQYGEQISQFFISVAKFLVAAMDPDYARVSEDDDILDPPFPNEIANKRVKAVFWGNYYRADFLLPASIELFKSAPIGFIELTETGLWYQINKTIMAESRVDEVLETEGTLQNYFKDLGLERVQWCFVN